MTDMSVCGAPVNEARGQCGELGVGGKDEIRAP